MSRCVATVYHVMYSTSHRHTMLCASAGSWANQVRPLIDWQEIFLQLKIGAPLESGRAVAP